MLKGYSKTRYSLDSRLPITLPILFKILDFCDQFLSAPYSISQFKAMCSLAFHAFLRIGEMTFSSKVGAPPPLQFHQVQTIRNSTGQTTGIQLIFHDFEHNYNTRPFSLFIYRKARYCPVQFLLDYFNLRGTHTGSLFMNIDGSPVSRNTFQEQLVLALKFCGFDPCYYKGHSFRIGAATLAAQQGLSDAQIRAMGRWKSDSFKKYIRIESVIAS